MLTIEQVAHTTGFDTDQLIATVIEYWEIPEENREAVSRFTELTDIEAVYLAGHFRPDEKNLYNYGFIYDFVKQQGSVGRPSLMEYVMQYMEFSRRSAERMVQRAQQDEPRLQDNLQTARSRCKVNYFWSDPNGK